MAAARGRCAWPLQVVSLKLSADATADKKGKSRPALGQVLHNHVTHSADSKAAAEASHNNLLHSLRHYALNVASELQPRIHSFACMLGLLEPNQATWTDKKIDFYVGFVAKLLAIKVGTAACGPPRGPPRGRRVGRRRRLSRPQPPRKPP